ncbi:hypothetical protein SUGI_0122490 [Cryptomeria japonica]|nr:hypothetical protein SUGI_0122490 [Cryptomeria japonica]
MKNWVGLSSSDDSLLSWLQRGDFRRFEDGESSHNLVPPYCGDFCAKDASVGNGHARGFKPNPDPKPYEEQELQDRVDFGSSGCDGELRLGKGAITPKVKEKCRFSRSEDMEEASLVDNGKAQHDDPSMTDLGIFSKEKSLGWQIEVARLEDGWHTVKRRKERIVKNNLFDMVLCSHSKGGAKVKF